MAQKKAQAPIKKKRSHSVAYRRKQKRARRLYIALREWEIFDFPRRSYYNANQIVELEAKVKELRHALTQAEEGKARLVIADPESIALVKDRYHVTRKGIIVYGDEKEIQIITGGRTIQKYAAEKRKIKKKKSDYLSPDDYKEFRHIYGDFKDRVLIESKKEYMRRVFIPRKEGESITELSAYVFQYFNPDYVTLAVGKNQGNRTFDFEGLEDYSDDIEWMDEENDKLGEEIEFLEYVLDEMDEMDDNDPLNKIKLQLDVAKKKRKPPFTGVYAIWFE